jgi:hypothetical protein
MKRRTKQQIKTGIIYAILFLVMAATIIYALGDIWRGG